MAVKQQTGNKTWQAISGKVNTTTDEQRRANYTERGLENLAVAIVQSGIEEYRFYGCKIKMIQYKLDNNLIAKKSRKHAKATIKECEEEMKKLILFFRSAKFKHLCTLDPDWVIKTLNKQIEEYDPEEDLRQKEEEKRKKAERKAKKSEA